MGLINLLTDPKNFKFYNGGQGYTGDGSKPNLKNLPYGNDRIYNGNSKQPYITYSIDNGSAQVKLSGTPFPGNIPNLNINLSTNIPNGLTNLSNWNNDFILRGGTRAVTDSAIDVVRLTKWFTSSTSPNGLFFVSKQQLLSRTAVRTQTSGVLGILNQGTYSPLNTLAQAGVNFAGFHLNKQGLNPFQDTGTSATNNQNLYMVKVQPGQADDNNRLYTLYKANTNGRLSIKLGGFTYYGGNNNPTMMSYSGGPGSILGIGRTNIKYSPTSQTFLSKNPTNTYNTSNIDSNVWLFSSINTKNQSGAIKNGSVSSPKVGIDFRQYIREQLSILDKEKSASTGQLSVSPNYTTKNIEQRVNLGDPGQRQGKNYSDYSKGIQYDNIVETINNGDSLNINDYISGLDRINSSPIYRSEAVTADDSIKNDLCKFRIAIIDNDAPNFKTFMHFRAFLGPINDSYTAEWNPVQYLGRGEKFYNYNGFTRQMSLSWTVVAQSKQELIKMYKKLNYLASSLTPDYSSTGYMRGNLAQLTIGGYVYEQPGIITGLSYEIQEDTTWEIGINPIGESDTTVKELPHIIRVTGFNFIPIQTFRPSIQDITFNNNANTTNNTSDDTGFAYDFGSQRYISLTDGSNNNYDNYGNTGYTPKPNVTILDNGIPTANA
jgi:hypothetical protein